MLFITKKGDLIKNLALICVVGFICAQILLIFLSSPSYATTSKQSDIEAVIKESNSERTVIKFDIKHFTKESVMIGNESFYKINCDDSRLIEEKGFPELPRLCNNITIPYGSDVQLNILDTEYEDYPLTPIAPSKGMITRNIDPETIPYTFSDIYNSSEWYPQNIASLSEPFIIRDMRGITVFINSFSYQPSTQTLRVYHSVTVEIVKTTSDRVIDIHRTEANGQFEGMYDYLFLNYDAQPTKAPTRKEKMLIITKDEYRNAMKPFVAWKNQKGIETEMVNISQVSSSNSSSEIKNYIKNYYNQNNNLVYVLLVGDYAHISSPRYGSGVSDPEYTKIIGNDHYPDIFVGRFSAESVADVKTQVRRTLEFEKNGYNKLPWFKRGIGIASNQGPGHNGEYDNQHMDIIRRKLLNGAGYTKINRVYDPTATAAKVSRILNYGRGIINYCGHGSSTSFASSRFNINNIKNLKNATKLPFIISVACVNGQFYDRTCFAEAWLRSKDANGNPIGALATYMSTVNQPWVPPMTAQDAINNLIVNNSVSSFGGICYLGSSKLLNNGGSSDLLTFNTWTVFGDPSLQLFD